MAIDTLTSLSVALTGVTPLLMHNGQTADPLNQFSRLMSKLSGKRNKTEDDHEEMAHVEWWAGLYLNMPPEIKSASDIRPVEGTKLVLPAHLLDSCIREGARKSKLGKLASAGCFVDDDATFNYNGPKDLIKLSEQPNYMHRAAVRVKQSKVMRTRPIFHQWGCTLSVTVDTTVIEPEQVVTSLEMAGKLIGIGDWRPGAPRGGSFGKFVVEAE